MFQRLARAMEREELASEALYGQQEKRLAARSDVIRLVEAWTTSLDRKEVMERCLAHDVPIGPLNTIADIFNDPQFKARENLVTLSDPDLGPVVVPAVLPKLSETPGSVRSLGPALGDANVEIYQGFLGLSEEEMARLRADGII